MTVRGASKEAIRALSVARLGSAAPQEGLCMSLSLLVNSASQH